MKYKESDVLKACQDYLEAKGILYIRHNIISPVTCGRPGIFGKGRKSLKKWVAFRKVRESQTGSPDLIIFVKGYAETIPVAVECKSRTGKLSPAQKVWQDRANKAGLEYAVVREIADLVEVVEGLS